MTLLGNVVRHAAVYDPVLVSLGGNLSDVQNNDPAGIRAAGDTAGIKPKIKNIFPLAVLLLPVLAGPSPGQDVGRVSPASLPLPLPTAGPMPPDRLRAQNPWNLPMTGPWRFKLTHGSIVANRFVPGTPVVDVAEASSSQAEHPPGDAFDGSADTRWCADGPSLPQSLQVDLGQTRRVAGRVARLGAAPQVPVPSRGQPGWQTVEDARR